jgi:hypothetical protein
MKRTLLNMTQSILSTIDGDAVNSISDTVESLQVAEQIKLAYFELIDELQLPANHDLITLEALSDTANPHLLRLPDNVSRLIYFKYDKRELPDDPAQFDDVVYKTPQEFVDLVNKRDSTSTEYFVWTNPNGVKLTIGKNAHPSYWTTFDDEHLLFDSYESAIDSSLQASKSQAYVEFRPVFEMQDDFIPDLPENMFSLLYSSAENRSFYNSKQRINPLGNRNESRNRTRAQRNKFRQEHDQNKWGSFPDYGRRRP